MKYKKAATVLPAEVLATVQRYVQGELIYIPKPKEAHKKWGENTRGKEITARRNEEIRRAYRSGQTIDSLSSQYHLSPDSIRKIAYGKK